MSLGLRTLDLEGRGEDLVLDGEGVGLEVDRLGKFKAAQLSFLANLGELVQDSLVDIGVLAQLLVAQFLASNAGQLGSHKGVERLGLRHDDGDETVLQRVTVQEDLGHNGVLGVYVLDLLGSNVLTLGELENVLLAVNDDEAAKLVEGGDITAVVPALLVQRLTRLLLVLIIAHKDIGAADAELTAGVGVGRQVVHLGNVYKLELVAGEWNTDMAGAVLILVVNAGRGAGLGGTVALTHVAAQSNTQELHDVGTQRGRAANNETNAATQSLAHLVEDDAIPDGMGVALAGFQVGELGSDSTAGDGALDTGSLDGLLHDAGVDTVQETGDRGEDGGLQELQVIQDLSDVAREVADTATASKRGEVDQTAKDVSQREVGDRHIIIEAGAHVVVGSRACGDKVAVREHSTLGHAGSTTGVHDEGKIVGLGIVVRAAVLLTGGLERSKVDEEDILLGSPGLDDLALGGGAGRNDSILEGVHGDDGTELGQLVTQLQQLSNVVGRADDNLDLGVVDNVLDGVSTECVVQRHSILTVGSTGEVGDGPLGAVVGPDTDGHALRARVVEGMVDHVHKTRAKVRDTVRHLAEGLPNVRTALTRLGVDRAVTKARTITRCLQACTHCVSTESIYTVKKQLTVVEEIVHGLDLG